jgi:hypothetical protein
MIACVPAKTYSAEYFRLVPRGSFKGKTFSHSAIGGMKNSDLFIGQKLLPFVLKFNPERLRRSVATNGDNWRAAISSAFIEVGSEHCQDLLPGINRKYTAIQMHKGIVARIRRQICYCIKYIITKRN